jgi:uncharacterized protein (UPF0297 family)
MRVVWLKKKYVEQNNNFKIMFNHIDRDEILMSELIQEFFEREQLK